MGGAAEPQAPGEPAPPVPLRRNRGFRWLWIGQVVSDTGTEAALIAYPLRPASGTPHNAGPGAAAPVLAQPPPPQWPCQPLPPRSSHDRSARISVYRSPLSALPLW